MKKIGIVFCLFYSLFCAGQDWVSEDVKMINKSQSLTKGTTSIHTESEISIEKLLNIIKFETGDTIFTSNSLQKLNQLVFSYPDYGFKIIGLNNKSAYFIERRWKAIRNHLLKAGQKAVCVEILASGSLKSFTPKQRCVNIVIFGD